MFMPRLDACWTVSSHTGCTKISTDHSPWIHTACDVDTASRWLVQTQASMRRYFNGIYKYLRAAKEGREKLHGHLVQPDSLGIALLAVASSGQLCTQVSTAPFMWSVPPLQSPWPISHWSIREGGTGWRRLQACQGVPPAEKCGVSR